MKIHLENYRNIGKLDYEPEDGKINFLFGICGSGKSSILRALSSEVQPIDVSCGLPLDATMVLVNGDSPSYGEYQLYCDDVQSALFKKDADAETYRILVGDEAALEESEKAFLSEVEQLREHLSDLHNFRSQVEELTKQMGKGAKQNTEFGKAAKIEKLETAIKSASTQIREAAEKQGASYLKWKADGATIDDSFELGVCPFCGSRLSEEIKNQIEEIESLKISDFKLIDASTTVLSDLGLPSISNLNNSKQLEELKSEVLKIYRTKEEIDDVISLCLAPKKALVNDDDIKPLELSEDTYKRFPSLEHIVQDVNAKNIELKRLVSEMRGTFNRMVSQHLRILNQQLKAFSIPYKFEKDLTDRNSKTASFLLSHIESVQDDDMRTSLSTGEKNIVALLLFLQDQGKDTLLIDDPASSFDDFRRSQIYSQICRVKNKTVIVVSHDQAFIRRAVNDTRNERRGKIQMISAGSDGFKIQEITKDDYCYLDDAIKNRIARASSYEQQIVNARLFAEIHKAVNPIVYEYLSAILHGTTKEEIQVLLTQREVSENYLLNMLSEEGISIDEMPEIVDFKNIDGLCVFEKLILLRELLTKKKNQGISLSSEEKEQVHIINDIVHMNDSMMFCLNPYTHILWPASLVETITSL